MTSLGLTYIFRVLEIANKHQENVWSFDPLIIFGNIFRNILVKFEDFRKFSTFSSLGSLYTERVLQSQAMFGLSCKIVGVCRDTFCDKLPEAPLHLTEPVPATWI